MIHKNVVLSIRLERETYEALMARALRDGRTGSDLARHLIATALGVKPPAGPRAPQRPRARRIAGSKRS
jgi:hypothetical protein